MKPFQNENSVVFTNVPTFQRGIGALFLVLALASFLFAYFGANYFGAGSFSSIVIYAVISIVVGLIFSGCGTLLVSMPDKKLEVSRTTGKIILTEKLFRTTTEEFLTSDVEKVEVVTRNLENGEIYLSQITLRDGRIVEIPSDGIGDEKRQTEICEQVGNLLSK